MFDGKIFNKNQRLFVTIISSFRNYVFVLSAKWRPSASITAVPRRGLVAVNFSNVLAFIWNKYRLYIGKLVGRETRVRSFMLSLSRVVIWAFDSTDLNHSDDDFFQYTAAPHAGYHPSPRPFKIFWPLNLEFSLIKARSGLSRPFVRH